MKRQIPHIYVSIPYTGHEDEFPLRCVEAKNKYSKDGKVITPIDVVKDSSTPYNMCMGKCIETLLGCDKVIFANGWAESKGCSLEMNAVLVYGIDWKVDPMI